MQAQAKINQEVAVALERLNGRMENLEKWRNERDDERERASERRDDRDDKAPDHQRANLAITISIASVCLYALGDLAALILYIASHWR